MVGVQYLKVRTYRLGDNPHGFWVLVCEEREQCGERAEAGCEEDEEGKLLLWIHRHFVEGCKKGHSVNQVTRRVAGQVVQLQFLF